ncbi:hypothetical protein Lal_00013743 [Lupinus albus]|uniref:Putative lysine methyltransferase, S-adenosyl-L-methionine-dependent methyltransferase n=1 Tax=Lupinus albus TaxID=3870 RepID=A0A6A4PA34_LUPAL|nr:putative lysine methyltransferase, S-adenosyl-L-methionine-dependent methyltransferase [Lupinus albus]KAF1874305.1 hypothetical protein Lal_00013743 [Lupinus albus]
MSNEEIDEDEINPFTMLLTDDQDHTLNSVTTVHEGTPNQQDHHHLRSIQSTVVIRQLPSEGLSFQLWPAATALVSLLDLHRLNPSQSPLSATLSAARATANDRPLKILELGSGTGIVGIVAAATLGGDVTITDLPHVVPNLQFNADANKEVVGSTGGAVKVASLRWGHADDVAKIGREFDIILASDVVYHDHLYDPLLETLRLMTLVSDDGKERKKMVFVMAHLRRWKKESSFFKKAKKLFEVDVLHTDSPCEGSRVGVIIYRFVGKV